MYTVYCIVHIYTIPTFVHTSLSCNYICVHVYIYIEPSLEPVPDLDSYPPPLTACTYVGLLPCTHVGLMPCTYVGLMPCTYVGLMSCTTLHVCMSYDMHVCIFILCTYVGLMTCTYKCIMACTHVGLMPYTYVGLISYPFSRPHTMHVSWHARM